MIHTEKRESTANELTGKWEEERLYSIDEVALLYEVNVWTIRYWANMFSVLKPRQGANGNVLFSNADVERIGLIDNLSKERGTTVKKVCELLQKV